MGGWAQPPCHCSFSPINTTRQGLDKHLNPCPKRPHKMLAVVWRASPSLSWPSNVQSHVFGMLAGISLWGAMPRSRRPTLTFPF